MVEPPAIEDVVALLTSWGGPMDEAVVEALVDLGMDEVMRAFTGAVADLLAAAARDAVGDDALSASILVERTLALARSGRMATAVALAEPVLDRPELPPAARAALLRTTILAYAADARVADVDRLVERVDRARVPPQVLRRLDAHRAFAHVLRGDPVARATTLAAPEPPEVSQETGTLPMATAAIAAMLAGDGERAVELVERAARGHADLTRRGAEELASIDIWPPLFRLFTYGRHDARAQLDRWREASRGQAWVDPYHQISAASIAVAFGELDDAAAVLDGALTAAAETGQGWISWAVGLRARIDATRGDLTDARDRIEVFRSSGRPPTLGLHIVDLASAEISVALGEEHDDPLRSWTAGVDDDNRLWMLLGGLDAVRVARRRQLDEQPILETLAGLDAPTALAHVPAFARAALAHDFDGLVDAVDTCRSLAGLLEAARLAGDAPVLAAEQAPAAARRLGTRAVAELHELHATGDERALAAELRSRGVRLGVRGTRSRPTTGWEALTPTEERIVALVAEGVTGPDIGRLLYISPRTVQTHVSHALAKLGLSNRLELATAYTTRDP